MPPAAKSSKKSDRSAASNNSNKGSKVSTTTTTTTITSSTRSAHALLSQNNNKTSSKSSSQSHNSQSHNNNNNNDGEDHPDLVELEERLTQEVDDEFFQDPRKFHTLHRVIDVLGMQLDSKDQQQQQQQQQQWLSGGKGDEQAQLARELISNPAYKVLKEQQQVVEEAIEHLALIHCADLNGSVVQVGRVARQFNDAVTQVRHLRKQVKEIQETLGASETTTAGGGTTQQQQQQQQAVVTSAQAAMSLRELWLKKLEAEAVLSLLDKLDRIRAAPRQFDICLKQHRIGAAVITVAQALDTMFSSDVAQVQALHKIMEQLMIRKQTAEEVVTELLLDVIFLRTGNGPVEALAAEGRRMGLDRQAISASANGTGSASGSGSGSGMGRGGMGRGGMGGGRGGGLMSISTTTTGTKNSNSDTNHHQHQHQQHEYYYNQPYDGLLVNPFLSNKMRFAVSTDLQVEPTNALGLVAAAAAKNNSNNNAAAAAAAASNNAPPEEDWQEDDVVIQDNMMIPKSLMDADFDLESEERRHLEELQQQRQQQQHGNSGNGNEYSPYGGSNSTNNNKKKKKRSKKPQYGDSILALRTLVECLIRLRRLDDVERILTDSLPKEVEALVQREQARTFLRVEGSASHQLSQSGGRMHMLLSKAGATTDLRDFRAHLQSVVSAFGNVQLRMAHLAQLIRHRLSTERTSHSAAYAVPTAALASAIKTGQEVMEKELKSFLQSCLHESEENKEPEFNINALTNVSGQTRTVAAKTKSKRRVNGLETGLFSLGILDAQSTADSAASTAEAWLTASTTSRRSTIQSMGTPKFVQEVLFAKTTHNGTPQVRHALFFRKALSKWHQDITTIRNQLAMSSQEDTSAPSFRQLEETPALEYLDMVIQKDLLPVLQEEAVNGTVQALERPDAFDPVLDRNVYARTDSNEPQDVDMCRACNALYNFTGPLFLALHRLPKGGEMYLPLVAVLEHVILTFISRVKQQVSKLCTGKTALQLIMDTSSRRTSTTSGGGDATTGTSFAAAMERRKAFAQLVLAYADGDMLEAAAVTEDTEATTVPLLSPSANDSPNKALIQQNKMAALSGMEDLDFVGGVEREEVNLSNELQFIKPFLEFAGMEHNTTIKTCTDEHLMKGACLAHSLLKLSSLLDSRLKVRSAVGGIATKTLTNTRALREAIKTIKANGLKMAKFCRADVLLQSITRLSKVCNSSTVVARDAVRIPSSVNDLGEYMTAASDNLREAAGNAVTAYTFSTLEQYIPLCLIQTVRVLAAGKGIVTKAPLTMNGIEALDRSGSVLYRDLKGATSFDNSFWDIELAAVSFERSASFIAMLELEMTELEAYFQENRNDFSDPDFQLMFSMNGPRRKGDIGRYHMLIKRLDKK